MREITRIIVHCTASSQERTTIDGLKYWFKCRGWKNPGYHYVITPRGDTVQMLRESLISNGAKGYNATAINIAYIGGVDADGKPQDNRTIEQKATLVHLLLQLRERYPKALIIGHRDIWGAESPERWQKACPSFNATREYADI